MITTFLIGAMLVAAGWALLAFGRNWFDTTAPGVASSRSRMNRNAKKGGCQ